MFQAATVIIVLLNESLKFLILSLILCCILELMALFDLFYSLYIRVVMMIYLYIYLDL